MLGSQGGVQAAMSSARQLMDAPAAAPDAMISALRSLALLCVGSAPNAHVLASQDGWTLVKSILGRAPREPLAQAHACTLLACLFPHALASHNQQFAAQSVLLATNLVAVSVQQGTGAVMRAGVWALACMVSDTAQLSQGPLQHQVWTMLSSQALHVVLEVLTTAAKQVCKLPPCTAWGGDGGWECICWGGEGRGWLAGLLWVQGG